MGDSEKEGKPIQGRKKRECSTSPEGDRSTGKRTATRGPGRTRKEGKGLHSSKEKEGGDASRSMTDPKGKREAPFNRSNKGNIAA